MKKKSFKTPHLQGEKNHVIQSHVENVNINVYSAVPKVTVLV